MTDKIGSHENRWEKQYKPGHECGTEAPGGDTVGPTDESRQPRSSSIGNHKTSILDPHKRLLSCRGAWGVVHTNNSGVGECSSCRLRKIAEAS